jgi:hypothetical protein
MLGTLQHQMPKQSTGIKQTARLATTQYGFTLECVRPFMDTVRIAVHCSALEIRIVHAWHIPADREMRSNYRALQSSAEFQHCHEAKTAGAKPAASEQIALQLIVLGISTTSQNRSHGVVGQLVQHVTMLHCEGKDSQPRCCGRASDRILGPFPFILCNCRGISRP